MRYSAVLFDLDGTLVHSVPDIAASINNMLIDLGHTPLSTQRISLFLGKGMEHLIQLTLQDANEGNVPTTASFEQAKALVIGDSSNDSIAARKAGIDVLIVPYGYNEGESVQSLDCDGIVPSIAGAAKWAAQPKK